MSMHLQYTLLADGTSDKALLKVIAWSLSAIPELCDFLLTQQFATAPGSGLQKRILQACKFFPCDILFVHRDAERCPFEDRVREIESALPELQQTIATPIVPVRMTEAWLLHDEHAIRHAADNPNGTVQLQLPRLRDMESLPDPKSVLDGLLVVASEKTGRRLAQFKRDLAIRRTRVAALIKDFTPLFKLQAFQEFQNQTRVAVQRFIQEH